MSENGLHKIPAMRKALEQIRELHRALNQYDDECSDDSCERNHLELEDGLYHDVVAHYICEECSDEDDWDHQVDYPCATRRLADQALEEE